MLDLDLTDLKILRHLIRGEDPFSRVSLHSHKRLWEKPKKVKLTKQKSKNVLDVATGKEK